MANRTRKSLALVGIGAAAMLSIAACTSDEGTDTMTDTTTMSSPAEQTTAPMETTETGAATASGLVGPGCAAYAEQVPTGPGSVEGMAEANVTTAAANNPLLTTLTAALSGQLNPDVNLVDTLNGGEFTVFAPVDDAFAAVDPATIETLQTDSALLTDVLTYHVVAGQIAPADIAGEQTTVQGGTVEVTGSGDDWMVNEANVICGGVETENATVYLIDGVLLPQ